MKYYLLTVLDDAAQTRLTALSEQLTKDGFEYTRFTPYHITLWDGDIIDEVKEVLKMKCPKCGYDHLHYHKFNFMFYYKANQSGKWSD